jgi:hypothetical protein
VAQDFNEGAKGALTSASLPGMKIRQMLEQCIQQK